MSCKKELKGDYGYKCECRRVIKIDDKYKDYFFGSDEGDKVEVLVGECSECGKTTKFYRDAIGGSVHPLVDRPYKGKFVLRWEE